MDDFEKEQMDQIGQMDEGIMMDADTLDKEDETPTTEQSEEIIEEEVVEEETEETDEEEPKTEPPSTEEPEEDELADIKREMAELKAELAAQNEAPKTSPPATEEPIEEEDFFGDEDFDDVTTDKESFNKLLNKVYAKGIETGQGRAKKINESITDSINKLLNENLLSVASLEKASERFYDENEDLVPHASEVSKVYKEMSSNRPDDEYLDVLKDVAPEVRKRLGLTKPTKDEDKPPRLPKKKSQQRQSTQTKPKSNSMLDELDEMDKALNL